MRRALTTCLGTWVGPCPTDELVDRGRCPSCAIAYDRARRPSPTDRGLDAAWRRRVAAAIAAEPWCHWPTGCEFPIDDRNPLSGDHPIATAAGGSIDQDSVIYCRRHNSSKGDRPA